MVPRIEDVSLHVFYVPCVIQENEDTPESCEAPSAKARIETFQAGLKPSQRRDQWDSAINSIMNEDKPAPKVNHAVDFSVGAEYVLS